MRERRGVGGGGGAQPDRNEEDMKEERQRSAKRGERDETPSSDSRRSGTEIRISCRVDPYRERDVRVVLLCFRARRRQARR